MLTYTTSGYLIFKTVRGAVNINSDGHLMFKTVRGTVT
jgi:hypothetical protein